MLYCCCLAYSINAYKSWAISWRWEVTSDEKSVTNCSMHVVQQQQRLCHLSANMLLAPGPLTATAGPRKPFLWGPITTSLRLKHTAIFRQLEDRELEPEGWWIPDDWHKPNLYDQFFCWTYSKILLERQRGFETLWGLGKLPPSLEWPGWHHKSGWRRRLQSTVRHYFSTWSVNCSLYC